MFKDVIRSCVFIDFGEKILLGSDVCFKYYTFRFPTVTFCLMGTDMLDAIIEKKRKLKGYMADDTVYYEYYLGINGYTRTKLDTAIYAVVVNTKAGDEGECYDIQLTENEQSEIYAWLDEQCQEHIGKTCDELLEEAKKKMEKEVLF